MAHLDQLKLKETLDTLYRRYHREFIPTDPLQFVYRYDSAEDREVVALLASALAYGNVKQIFGSLERLLPLLGPSPAEFVRNFDPERDVEPLVSFRHRFNDGRDIACLLYFLQQAYQRYPTLEDLFLDGYSSRMAEDLTQFVGRLSALDAGPLYGARKLPRNAGVWFFLCAPKGGSACKRLCLFLRWMVRRDDGVDLGQWTRVSPADLVYPVDTHIATICRYLGLTARRTPSWKMAEDITERLRRLAPEDPVRYDFALTRLGILDIVRSRKGTVECSEPLLNHLS